MSAKYDLNWTPYFNMEGGINKYRIYVNEGSGIYQLAGIAGGSETSFSYTSLNADSIYCFFVQAVGNISSKTSTSNSTCIIATVFREPAFAYIRTAMVVSSNAVNVTCYVDSTAQVVSYNLLRSENATGTFQLISNLNYNGTSQFTMSDNDASVAEKSCYYKIESIDSCGNSVSKSNTAKNSIY